MTFAKVVNLVGYNNYKDKNFKILHNGRNLKILTFFKSHTFIIVKDNENESA